VRRKFAAPNVVFTNHPWQLLAVAYMDSLDGSVELTKVGLWMRLGLYPALWWQHMLTYRVDPGTGSAKALDALRSLS
jgi:hypothetical protein